MGMKKYSIILVFSLLSFVSCSELEEGKFENISDFHSSNLNPESFISSVEDDIIITGENGTQNLVLVGGLQHISGYLNFQFKELFKKSDLVLNNIPTNTFQEK